MMRHLVALVLVTVANVQARTFQNPVANDFSYYYPGAIKVNGTYYVVAGTQDEGSTSKGRFPIHTSTDLINWQPAGFIFENNDLPSWPRQNSFMFPAIHKNGRNYLAYYSAFNETSANYEISAAIAPHPLGPFTPIDRPIVADPEGSLNFPNIIDYKGTQYLIWEAPDYWECIKARELNTDGLSFASNQTYTLVRADRMTWDQGYVGSPTYFRHRNYHYLMYRGGPGSNKYSVGVARSRDVMGPYEKLETPRLMNNKEFDGTLGASVVKDLDDKSDIIFFTGEKYDSVLSSDILVASVLYDSDDWPYIEGF